MHTYMYRFTSVKKLWYTACDYTLTGIITPYMSYCTTLTHYFYIIRKCVNSMYKYRKLLLRSFKYIRGDASVDNTRM